MFRFFPPAAKLFGRVDFKVKLAGLGGVRWVRMFVDGAPQSGEMIPLGGGVYHQELDTALFVDGTHEIGAAGLDPQGNQKLTTVQPVEFHNIDQVNVVHVQQSDDRTALVVNLVVRSLRVPVPRETLTFVDSSPSGRETLSSELVFAGGVASGGVPIGTAQITRPSKARFAPGAHQITVGVSDIQGRPRTQGTFITVVP
jgi:hypothetical protein